MPSPPTQSGRRKFRIVLAAAWLFPCLLWLASCERKSQPSQPDGAGRDTVSESHSTAPQPTVVKPSRSTASGGVRFISYNVENWLTMERFDGRKSVGRQTKPEEEKREVIRILAAHDPDILGLCEVGTREDLVEIQKRMGEAGVPLPHLHHYSSADSVRSLGMLSRFPIKANKHQPTLEYSLNGRKFFMNRGILDATVDAEGLALRFLGVHLKSKREVEDGDQAAMRLNEARLLRRHVDDLFKADSQARLVVYGDFNDTFPSPTVRTITSHPDPAFRLRPVYLRDSRREAWTHHWRPHDIYSRIDFVTLSRPATERADYKASAIIDDPAWDKASDHRPLLVVFR